MSKLLVFASALFLGIISAPRSVYSAESINRIIATVGSQSISELDYDDAQDKYMKLSRFLKNEDTRKTLRSRIIDFLIDRAVVDSISEEESIQVNEKRLESEIDKRMEMMGISSRKQFEKAIEGSSGMTYDLWYSELPYQIKRTQLMQYKVPNIPPTEKDIRAWYNQNRDKVGFEIQFRQIAIAPANDSISEESRIHKEAADIRKTVQADPASFSLVAGSPRNTDSTLRARKGLIDWVSSFELFKTSRSVAAAVSAVPVGGVSEVFRDERKRYCVLKVEGKRPTPLENVRQGIGNLLMREKEEDNFQKWVKDQRSSVPIQIFDDAYKKENKIPEHHETFILD
ncbi:putative peptidyl-prolyl cis-trans isomerase [Leptospira semungkisensis]|uniref:putative peptidyl-prolyl cis-trans isomerase n=1 Tax=Leptospira semungkisensis TaxID=2484985 RepID=UPI003CCC699E